MAQNQQVNILHVDNITAVTDVSMWSKHRSGLFHEGVKVEVNGDPQNINLLIHQKKHEQL
jgi:hypothetical protein